ncbi:metal-dependent hydrolase [Fulvivirga sp. RKSG066]|uniref:metal-dependent hydrolase n=1 Tax=Fulvivirga aurantia TaxID=2529383 RepID=UPI0012BB4E4E|nr:metal-dependent hydrolase [Fulvivirga aurantia]MTI20042.1 metal-dependent hydrolase [Fulvivirga aurantia]
MDSFTQIVLGAAVGEAVAGRKIGNKAPLFGAIAGTIPDLDVFIGNAMGTVDALNFHRGFTHSLAFALIFAPLLGFVMRKLFNSSSATWRDWTLLFFLGFFTHALLDCFTTWGTQLFWPVDYRIAFKSIFVIDPLYTLPLTICLVWLMFLSKTSQKRQKLNTIGLVISSAYLVFSVVVKQHVNSVFEDSFAKENMKVSRYDTRPAPLNTLLWTSNAELADGYKIGYYSLLDNNKDIAYFYFPKNHDFLTPYRQDEDVKQLIDLTNGWYTIQPVAKGVIYNDLRFGQRTGWLEKEGDFVFSYHIYREDDKVHIEEVEKEFDDGKAIMSALWTRILGKD